MLRKLLSIERTRIATQPNETAATNAGLEQPADGRDILRGQIESERREIALLERKILLLRAS